MSRVNVVLKHKEKKEQFVFENRDGEGIGNSIFDSIDEESLW